MKKKLALFSGLSAAAMAVCVFVFILYRNFAFGGLDITLNSLQNAAFPIFGIMAGAVIAVRLVLPLVFRCKEDKNDSLPIRLADFGAWILTALCLSALVASPLAETADYIGLAALCAVLAVLCALVPAASLIEKCGFSVPFVIPCFVLSVFPALGIYSAISGTVMTVTALRDEKISKNQGIAFIAVGVFAVLVAAVSSFCFVYLLMIK